MNNRKRLINKLKNDELMKLKREEPVAYACVMLAKFSGVSVSEAASNIMQAFKYRNY